MKFILSILLFCFCHVLCSQKDSIVYVKYFSKDKKSKILYWRGVDTMEFIKYYKNGQIKDSSWFYLRDHNEIPFGVSKSYYEDGRLSTITHYGSDQYPYTSVSYWPDGKVSEQEVSTGVRKRYNKKGELIRQMDLNKNKFVYIHKKYDRHLININAKKFILTDQKKQLTIKNNALISITLLNDTNSIQLCKIENVTNDSVYLSKFSYNYAYDKTNKHSILKYDSTFALSNKQLKTIYYSKHYNGKRYRGAIAAQIAGVELMVVSLITIAVVVREPSVGLPVFGGTLLGGFALTQYSKYLFKTMVPKKYDLKEWQIKLKD